MGQEQRRRGKYHAIKTEVDGILFASKGEAGRYMQLKLLFQAGQIAHLELQPPYLIVVNGKKIAVYYADFRYLDLSTNEVVIEDFKGRKTAVYSLKKKLVEALYGIKIVEVYDDSRPRRSPRRTQTPTPTRNTRRRKNA